VNPGPAQGGSCMLDPLLPSVLSSPLSCLVWAQECCRISPPHFLTKCRMRRLNPAIFVLLFFCVVCFLWAVFSFCRVSVFDLSSVTYFPAWTKWMALYSLIVCMCRYESAHSLTLHSPHFLTSLCFLPFPFPSPHIRLELGPFSATGGLGSAVSFPMGVCVSVGTAC